jgi:hypothetical protein
MHDCKIGTKALFCMPNRTKCILLVSVMYGRWGPAPGSALVQAAPTNITAGDFMIARCSPLPNMHLEALLVFAAPMYLLCLARKRYLREDQILWR